MNEFEENNGSVTQSVNGSSYNGQNNHQDLGLGNKLGHDHSRLILENGKFNVKKNFLRFDPDRFNIFQELLWMKWLPFILLVVGGYLAINSIFALLYLMVGVENLSMPEEITGFVDQFAYAFYFSAQTFTTVGYGAISPVGHITQLIAALEAMCGVLGFALITGVLYGRFSRPRAKLAYSGKAIIAPYRGITSFQFKMINKRKMQMVEVEAKIVMMGRKEVDGEEKPFYYPLKLERDSVALFPLSWTVVHPIEKDSPLYGLTQDDLEEMRAEFLVMVKGFDETFCQTVHSRTSYRYDELDWGEEFMTIYHTDVDGRFVIEIEEVGKYKSQKVHG